MKHPRMDVNLHELDQIIDGGMRAPLSESDGEKLKAVLHTLAERVKRGELEPGDIDDQAVSDSLYTAGMRDPDLLVRTAGEMRVSNYLLWQISYAELWVTPKCWPDFDAATLHDACRAFAARDRRFGGLTNLRGAV